MHDNVMQQNEVKSHRYDILMSEKKSHDDVEIE